MDERREAYASLLRRQLGVIGRAQTDGVGLSAGSMARRVASGELERILPATFRHGTAHRNPDQFTMAVATWIGDVGALSHLTAARLWGMDRIPDDGFVHVVTPHRWLEPHPRVRVARAPLPSGHVTTRGLLRLTAPERTIVDCASLLTEARLISAMESAFHRGVTTPARLAGVLGAMGTKGRKGAGRIRRWLDVRGDGPALQRELEVVTARVLIASALPPATRQHPVVVDGEPFHLDFAWPEHLVALECDGWGVHGGRIPFESDRVRWAAVESVGWRIIPVTWNEINRRPDRILGRIATSLLTSER